nr:hypothetical protein [Bacteroidota bacterium]
MITMFSNCLTYEQLESYSLNTSEKVERAHHYMHISTCELCACAVNGFTAVSFTSAEVDAIKHQIDVRTNAAHAGPLTFAQALIAIVSVVSIFSFYHFAESFSIVEQKNALVENIVDVAAPNPINDNVPLRNEVYEKDIAEEKFANDIGPEEKISIPVEPFENITADLAIPNIKLPEVFIEPVFNADVIYIYDLKVTAYNEFYFNYDIKPFEMKGHTPSFKENKETENYLEESLLDRPTPADRILKSGLAYFGKEKYHKAIGEFHLLLGNNPDDVNALFYSAVSF